MQTSRTFNVNKCKGNCTTCFKNATGCLRESADVKPTRKKLFAAACLIITMLSGCSHSQWIAVKDTMQLASFMNPLGFAIHMGAAAGALFTEPNNDNE